MATEIEIDTIEDAMLGRLRTVNDGRLGYKVKSIETYGGEFDDDINQVIRGLPAFWVTYAGSDKPRPYGTSKTKWLMPTKFAVMAGARSVRGEPFSRRGLKSGDEVIEVGSYRMLRDARRLFLNQDFGLEIDRLQLGAVKTLYNTRMNGLALSVFAQEWHTAFIVEQEPGNPDAPDFLRLGLNYHLAPDDGNADATDIVNLSA